MLYSKKILSFDLKQKRDSNSIRNLRKCPLENTKRNLKCEINYKLFLSHTTDFSSSAKYMKCDGNGLRCVVITVVLSHQYLRQSGV